VICCAAKNNYKNIYIYNNGYSITDELLNQIAKNSGMCHINWIIQLVAHNDKIGAQLTGKDNYYSNVFRSMKTIQENYTEYGLQITCLIGNRNDMYIEDLINSVKELSLVPKIEFLYPAPDHSNASEKYKYVLFDHKSRLEKVDCIKYSYYSEHHNCFGRTLAVFFDGSIAPCIMMRRYIIDNTIKSRLSSVLSSEEFRKYSTLSKDKLDYCKDCSYRYGCFDCRAIQSNTGIHSVCCNLNE
jgi:radical SAM protein with 4Fe4S-binding SPASM domain